MRVIRFLDIIVATALCVLVPDNSASAQNRPLDIRPQWLINAMAPIRPAVVPKKVGTDIAIQQVVMDQVYPEGTVVIEQGKHRLSLMLKGGEAIRYPIAVGREGAQWKGIAVIAAKRENPDWYPTANMRARNPSLPSRVAGGRSDNPLGDHALYLKDEGTQKDRNYRIHGTIEPEKIGQNVSSGCIRMLNEHVKDLYERVSIGTRVVVLP